jgi:very-short-patch-repair endonuclease
MRLDAIPVTTPARALIDLSSMLSFKPLRRAVREAMAMKRVTLAELRGRTKALDEALAQGYVPTESELEDAVHDLILAHFLPPQVQPTLILDGIPTHPDFRYPDLKLSIEADGAQYHEHELARQDDAAKQARLEAHGDRVVRIT